MNLHNIKTGLALPVFLGGISSLVLCAFLAVNEPGLQAFSSDPGAAERPESVSLEPPVNEEIPLEINAFRILTGKRGQKPDFIQEMYRNPNSRERVIDFFGEICGSREIAETILASAEAFDIAPALAFALGWEESRFNPRAVNNKNRNQSIDRGLFQLNNRSFPLIESQAFFDPKVNARNGMSHLRFCLDTGGSEIAALAIYNAGSNRIKSSGAPRQTLDYANRILENRRNIETYFQERLRSEAEILMAEKFNNARSRDAAPEQDMAFLPGEFSRKLAESGQGRQRLIRLTPLKGLISW
ncbi:MAG: lytic transglycosylase domain-containing protein [Treponema sp.]|nr:lytic transglycosylase domain-containing protein [Treponema sp.]